MNLEERIKAMNIDQVEERLALMKQDIEVPGCDLDELNKEFELLKARKAFLKAEQEKRTKLLDDIANANHTEKGMETPGTTGRDTMEYRKAFMAYLKNGTESDVLQRAADQIESTDLGVLLPETIVQDVMTALDKQYGSLYSKVRKTNIKGGVKFPIGAFEATFKRITELTVSERQAAGGVTGFVQFGYNIGEIRIARTLLQSILTVEAFEREVAKVIVKAYIKNADYEIMNGDPSANQYEGILTEAEKSSGSRIATDHIIELSDDDISDWTAWSKKFFAEIPLAMEGENPEFVMAKQTYVSELVTMKDTTGQPIKKAGYDVTDRMHKFNEYPVNRVEKDILPAFDEAQSGDIFAMFWVPSKAYCINSNLNFTTIHYFDQETNQYVDKALIVDDGKILNPDYLYLFKKA